MKGPMLRGRARDGDLLLLLHPARPADGWLWCFSVRLGAWSQRRHDVPRLDLTLRCGFGLQAFKRERALLGIGCIG